MIKTTPKREVSERTFTLKGMPEDLYTRLVEESQKSRLPMKAILFQALERYLQPSTCIISFPEELDNAIRGYATVQNRPFECQVVHDLCEIYEIEEPE